MIPVARSVRDKPLITLVARAGLRWVRRRGLHRNDRHLMANSRPVSCSRAAPRSCCPPR